MRRQLATTMSHEPHQLQEITQELQASESRFRNLVLNSPDGVLIVGPDGLVRFVNPAAESLFGRTAEHLLGISFGFPMVVGETTELDILRKQREPAVAEMRVVETTWEGERVMLASLRDVTDRKRAEHERQQMVDELHRSNEELQLFAQVLSHDLQEPLRSVRIYCEILQERLRGQLDERSRNELQFAVDGAKRMQTQIRDLLDYGRVHSDSQSFAQVDLTEVVDDAIANLSVAISESRATVSQDGLPVVSGDRSQLLHVFQNLIGNAIKFHGDELPEIRITVERRDREWVISVSDNGIGIDPSHADRVFLIFQRLHKRDAYPGTGMGLAICKKIVERHGGRISVASQPGQGSTFSLTLPIDHPMETRNSPESA